MLGIGFGGDGYNVNGFTQPYLENLVPAPSTMIPLDGIIHFTISSQVYQVNIDQVQVTVAGVLAFDGSSFSSDFNTSSYTTSGSFGYSFELVKNTPYSGNSVLIEIEAITSNGDWIRQVYSVILTDLTDYPPLPTGTELNAIPISRFSGEATSGIFSGAQGLVFASPALDFTNSNSQIDLDSVEVQTQAGDSYEVIPGDNLRPFLWGPPLLVPPVPVPVFPPQFDVTNYKPIWNSAGFGLLKTTARSVYGVLHDTITLVDTVILY